MTFAHDEKIYKILEDSMQWQKAKMIYPKDFKNKISPYFNTDNKKYMLVN